MGKNDATLFCLLSIKGGIKKGNETLQRSQTQLIHASGFLFLYVMVRGGRLGG